MSEKALQAVRDSGVRNVSAHTEKLWINDLKRQKDVSKKEAQMLSRINEKLDALQDEWSALKEKLGREA